MVINGRRGIPDVCEYGEERKKKTREETFKLV